MEDRSGEYTRQALAGIPALTLLNPWGLAIARYGKDPENRTWDPPAGTRRFLVHAGKDWDPDGMAHLRRLGHEDAEAHVVPSAIVAIADLAGVCHVSQAPESGGRCECPPEWAAPGQVHWRLTDVVPLPEPVPCRGWQRLWYPAREVVDAVADSLALVAWEPLVCRGRRLDGRGRPIGEPHGAQFHPGPGETYTAMELRARMDRWKVGPRPADGSTPDAMCPSCANPSQPERELIDSLRSPA